MKHVLLMVIAILSYAVTSQAGVQTAQCESVMGTGRQIQLFFMEDSLQQIRVVAGGRSVPLIPVALQQQSNPRATVYSIMGSSELFEMQNTVSTDGVGYVRFNSDRFSCI